MSDEATTRRVTTAQLQESFALRDEIKQLRILIAAIVRRAGGKLSIHNNWIRKIHRADCIIKEDDRDNDCVVLTFEGKP
jgi:hypothetical protein